MDGIVRCVKARHGRHGMSVWGRVRQGKAGHGVPRFGRQGAFG